MTSEPDVIWSKRHGAGTWRRRRAVLGTYAIVVLATAGCSAAPDPRGPRYLSPLYSQCPAGDAPPWTSTAPTEAQPLAEDFVPTSAMHCTFTLAMLGDRANASAGPQNQGSGGWRQTSVRRSTGPLDDLARALRTPPEASDRPAVCHPVGVRPFVLTLTDATGATATPAIPASTCGRPVPAVGQAIEALTWENVE
ncbi:MAG TPA: hypothetical protein VK453_26150 [Micromonosporaceae bacterium]|nr:hypothetical protein [Micromonosporaceae bacterium]